MQAQSMPLALPAPSAIRNRHSEVRCQICGPSVEGHTPVPAEELPAEAGPVGDPTAEDDIVMEDEAEELPRRRTNALQRRGEDSTTYGDSSSV